MLSDDTSVAMPFFQCITRSFKTPTDTCARLANGLVYLPLRRVASLYSPGTMISRGILGIWAAFLSCTPATRRSFTSPLPSLATSPSLKGASPIRNPKPETRNPKPETRSCVVIFKPYTYTGSGEGCQCRIPQTSIPFRICI